MKHYFKNINLFLLIFITSSAYSQNSSWLTVKVPSIQIINIVHQKSIPVITASDIERGFVDITDAIQLEICSNVNWKLVVRANRENLYTTPGVYKSVSDFKWRFGTGQYKSLEMKPLVVLKGNAGTHNKIISLDYRIKLGWKTAPPGVFEYSHEFLIEKDLE